jgi:hypothetical protein
LCEVPVKNVPSLHLAIAPAGGVADAAAVVVFDFDDVLLVDFVAAGVEDFDVVDFDVDVDDFGVAVLLVFGVAASVVFVFVDVLLAAASLFAAPLSADLSSHSFTP